MTREEERARWRVYGAKKRGLPGYREKARNRDKAHEARRKADPLKRAQRAAQMRAYSKNPLLRHKLKARWIANRAIQSGKLIKQPCARCANPKAEKHHADYSKPLEVTWLCRPCHTLEHARATQS